MKMPIAIAFVLVTLVVYIKKTEAVCCTTYFSSTGHCLDCTRGTPYCGYGRCNIFGCACKGGCRRAGWRESCGPDTDGVCRCRRTRSLPDILNPQPQMNANVDVKDASNEIDTNKNKEIDLDEFTKALMDRGITNEKEIFKHWDKMDENKDGVITMDELDK